MSIINPEKFQQRMECKVIESVCNRSIRLEEFKEIFPIDWTQDEVNEFIFVMFIRGLLKTTGSGKYARVTQNEYN